MIKKFLTFLAAITLCSFLFPSIVHAQDGKPPWLDNLDCNKDEQVFSGIQFCKGKLPYSYIYITVIQLKNPDMRIEYLLPNGVDKNGNIGECKDVNRSTKNLGGPGCDDPNNRNWYPVMSLEQAVTKAQQQPNLVLVLNGDYSACTISPGACVDRNGNSTYREHGPEGLTVVRGNRLDGKNNGDGDNNIVARPYLVISKSSPLIAELHQSNSDNGLNPYSWAYTGIGGAPWLIQNGKVSKNAIESCENASGSCYDGASQTAVGLTLDKKWMFLVVAVKAKNLLEVATFMNEKLDVWQAIKFDGGGSTQLYYAGANNRYVETGDKRLLTNYLAIYAQPGEGIFSESQTDPSEPPESPSDSDLNWWQKIQKDWEDFWDGVDTWLNDIKTWWQELPQRIEDWLLQQVTDWLNEKINQLCGSAGLIPVTIAIVLYSRKRCLFKD